MVSLIMFLFRIRALRMTWAFLMAFSINCTLFNLQHRLGCFYSQVDCHLVCSDGLTSEYEQFFVCLRFCFFNCSLLSIPGQVNPKFFSQLLDTFNSILWSFRVVACIFKSVASSNVSQFILFLMFSSILILSFFCSVMYASM